MWENSECERRPATCLSDLRMAYSSEIALPAATLDRLIIARSNIDHTQDSSRFSSTLKTSAFSGGFKYRPITSARFGGTDPRRQLRRDTVVRIEPSQRG